MSAALFDRAVRLAVLFYSLLSAVGPRFLKGCRTTKECVEILREPWLVLDWEDTL